MHIQGVCVLRMCNHIKACVETDSASRAEGAAQGRGEGLCMWVLHAFPACSTELRNRAESRSSWDYGAGLIKEPHCSRSNRANTSICVRGWREDTYTGKTRPGRGRWQQSAVSHSSSHSNKLNTFALPTNLQQWALIPHSWSTIIH